MVSGSSDTTVRMWEIATGACLVMVGHTRSVDGIAVASDGSQIATASDDRTVRLWDSETRSLLATYAGHDKGVAGVAFAPNGSLVASCSRDQTLRLWDSTIRRRAPALHYAEQRVTHVVLDPTQRCLATCSDVISAENAAVCLWDTTTCLPIAPLAGSVPNPAVVFAPDGQTLVAEGRDEAVCVYDTATGNLLFALTGFELSYSGIVDPKNCTTSRTPLVGLFAREQRKG